MKKILDKINGEFGKGEIWAIVCVFILAVGLTICPVLRTLADEIRGLTQYSDTTGKSTRILPIPAINTDTLNKINADRLNLSGISHLTITDTGVKTHTEIDGHINGTGAAVHGLGTASTRADTYFEPAISGDPDTSKYWRADKTWQTVVGGGGGDMYKADNLSGLADAATARGNLGLGTASTHADTEYEDAGAVSGHESTYNHANYDTAYSKVNADSASWDAKQSALTSGGDGTAILDGVKIRSLKNSAGITWHVGGDSVRGEVAADGHGHTNMTTQGNSFNGASQLVQLSADSKLPAVDGSLLTNLPASGYGALTNPATLSNNDNTKLVTAQISTTASYGDQTLDALASYIYGAYQFSSDNTIINDLVGSRNLTNVGGTVTGATGGKNGAYALLNGSTQSFYLTPPTAPRHTAISLWFYHGGDIGLRVVCGGKTNSASHFSAYIMSNTLYCRLEANASVYDSVGVTANAWHHLLMYCDSTANKFYAYVDGSPTANTPVTFAGSPQNFVDNYYLGYLDKAEHDHINGRIDEAIIWHSDSTQILNGTSAVTTFANTLYNSSSGKFLEPGGVQKYDISTLKTSSLEPAFTNLAYSKLPTGGGTWANGGDLTIETTASGFFKLKHTANTGYAQFHICEDTTQKAYIGVLGSAFAADATRRNVLEIATIGANPITFRPNDTVAMTIASGGKVGVGTASPPTAILQLHSASTATTLGIERTANTTNGIIKFSTGTLDTNDDWIFGLRNTSDSDLHLYSYGTSSDVLVVKRDTGNVGIGTASPASKLTTIGTIALGNSDAYQSCRIEVADGMAQATDARFLLRNGTDTHAALRIVANSTKSVSIDAVQASSTSTTKNLILNPNGGNVGIGCTPGYLLDLLSTGDARKTGAHWVDLSDERMKKDITQLSGAMDIIKNLRGVKFKWKPEANKGDTTKEHIGLIAQEVETVLPDWTTTDDKGLKHVKIGNDTALFIEAFKEIQAQIDALKTENSNLKKRIEKMEAKQ